MWIHHFDFLSCSNASAHSFQPFFALSNASAHSFQPFFAFSNVSRYMRPPRPAPAPVPCRRPVPCGAHMARRPVSLPPSVLSVFAKTFPFRPKKVPRFFGRPPFLCYLCIRFRPQAGHVPAGASFFERIYIKDREKVVQESGIPLPARPMPRGAGVSV